MAVAIEASKTATIEITNLARLTLNPKFFNALSLSDKSLHQAQRRKLAIEPMEPDRTIISTSSQVFIDSVDVVTEILDIILLPAGALTNALNPVNPALTATP